LVLGPRLKEAEEEEEEDCGTLTLELGKRGLERSRGTEGAEGARGLDGPARRPLLRPFDSELPLLVLLLGWNQLLLLLLVEGAGAGAEGTVKGGWVGALEGAPLEAVEGGGLKRLGMGLVVVVVEVEGLPSAPPEGKPPKPLDMEEEAGRMVLEGGKALEVEAPGSMVPLEGGKARLPPRPTLEGAGAVVAGLDPKIEPRLVVPVEEDGAVAGFELRPLVNPPDKPPDSPPDRPRPDDSPPPPPDEPAPSSLSNLKLAKGLGPAGAGAPPPPPLASLVAGPLMIQMKIVHPQQGQYSTLAVNASFSWPRASKLSMDGRGRRHEITHRRTLRILRALITSALAFSKPVPLPPPPPDSSSSLAAYSSLLRWPSSLILFLDMEI
jgi:hypothetical protein